MTLNLAVLLRQSAREYPERVAVIDGEVSYDYRELHCAAQRFAGALRARGLNAGERIGLILPNSVAFTIAYYGALYAQLTIVPLGILLTADELTYYFDDADVRGVVTAPAMLGPVRVAAARARRRPVAWISGPSAADETENFSAAIATATPITELPATRPDDTAVVLYTSGTTGRPKGAELTHLNLHWNAEYMSTRFLPLDADTVSLVALPLFHSFGQTVMHNAILGIGGTAVMMSRFEPRSAVELMKRHAVSFFAGVPTMYVAMLAEAADMTPVPSLRFCVCGGAPMPPDTMRRFDAAFGVSVLEGYGLSETSPVASFNVLDRPKRVGSIGLPLRGVEFRLRDDGGRVIEGPGQPGEVLIKGPNVMKGYLGRPEATADVVRDGWLATGDLAVVDEDGFYWLVGRKKELIIRGGYNVYPREVEDVLCAHPAVREAAIFGVPSPLYGEEVKAVVVLETGADVGERELIEHCQLSLAAYKYPRSIEFRAQLPRGPTGKLLREMLSGT